MTESPEAWSESNRAALGAAVAVALRHIERHVAQITGAAPPPIEPVAAALAAHLSTMSAPPAFERLRAFFALSPFELDVVIVCAAVELRSEAAALLAQLDMRRPTFSLLLTAFPHAHWSALAPTAGLRWASLVTLGTGDAITRSPLVIDERVLHFLTGTTHIDERLASFAEILGTMQGGRDPVSAHPERAELCRDIVWALSESAGAAATLVGDDDDEVQHIVSAVAAAMGRQVLRVALQALPNGWDEGLLLRLVTRDALLEQALVWLDGGHLEAQDPRAGVLERLAERLGTGFIQTSPTRPRAGAKRIFELAPLGFADVCRAWQRAATTLGLALDGGGPTLGDIAMQFRLPERGRLMALIRAHESEPAPVIQGERLWQACRIEARSRLDGLAQRVDARVAWADLILPEPIERMLAGVVREVRHRAQVYEMWGLGESHGRGLGVTALFTGASGTGKTLAAEVLASELGLDLHRVDLSQVVSKYIGETEKNLRRVFDAAEEGGSVLLFDEADALFGKRTEVKDSHDRHANIEVSYLLQRMEAYRGLAILTSNFKAALDPAFVRRLRFIVAFPFPGPAERLRIWRRAFPPAAPTEGLDYERLARLNVAGGNIRNIALGAAFRAAAQRTPIRMEHVVAAAHDEYAKLEKPMTELDR